MTGAERKRVREQYGDWREEDLGQLVDIFREPWIRLSKGKVEVKSKIARGSRADARIPSSLHDSHRKLLLATMILFLGDGSMCIDV